VGGGAGVSWCSRQRIVPVGTGARGTPRGGPGRPRESATNRGVGVAGGGGLPECRRGDRNRTTPATARGEDHRNRPSIVSVGTIVWLSSELMFFAALFAMYFTVRAVQGPAVWAAATHHLNRPFAAVNTTVLVLSSVTCQMGVFAAERG
jgi:hypothetical protein